MGGRWIDILKKIKNKYSKWEFRWKSTEWIFSSTVSRSNLNLEMLVFVAVFVEGGKLDNPAKNPRSKDENQQQTQPTHDTGSRIRTRPGALSPLRHPCYAKCQIWEKKALYLGRAIIDLPLYTTEETFPDS